MSYQVIQPNTSPVYLDFMKHPISRPTSLDKYEHFYACSGLWNNGCAECTIEKFKSVQNWMCTGDYYESSDGKSIFLHGYSLHDME